MNDNGQTLSAAARAIASLTEALSPSLADTKIAAPLLAALTAALDAVDPRRAVCAEAQLDGKRLMLGKESYDLSRIGCVRVVGAGKAAGPMAEALHGLLGSVVDLGLVIKKKDGDGPFETGPIRIATAGHPVPDAAGALAAREVMRLSSELTKNDLLLCLISGGASALLTLPADGISLDDLRAVTALLLDAGAEIHALNAVRKHLSAIKGGQLARAAHPARVGALILSDVVGDELDTIGSGPTVPDPTTFTDALNVLRDHRVLDSVPASVRQRLEQGCRHEIAETPKPGDPIFKTTRNLIIGGNRIAAEAAVAALTAQGLQVKLLTTAQTGAAREVGKQAAAWARSLAENRGPLQRPACLVVGGETTVTVKGNGKGGRNQELALSAVEAIAGLKNVAIAAFATDGQDGPTDAAGAVITGETLSRAHGLGLDPGVFLENNDAYGFFNGLGDLLHTGPTGTNVADLLFIFAL